MTPQNTDLGPEAGALSISSLLSVDPLSPLSGDSSSFWPVSSFCPVPKAHAWYSRLRTALEVSRNWVSAGQGLPVYPHQHPYSSETD